MQKRKILQSVLMILFPVLCFSQQVQIQVVKSNSSKHHTWQVRDKNLLLIIDGEAFGTKDTASFWLDFNERYFWDINPSESDVSDSISYTLSLNREPILIVLPKLDSASYSIPFFTGYSRTQLKIIGGTDASIADFPWQVFYQSGNFACGGSIISEYWIATAAHCTEDDSQNPILAENMLIVAGTAEPYNRSGREVYEVEDVFVHEDYNSNSMENDIAILKLKTPINFEIADSIEIINTDDVADGATDPGVMSWVTGWGLTNVDPDETPDVLQKVELPIVSNTVASVVWGKLEETLLMAGYRNGNKDACNGDSGGPLVVLTKDGYKLAGIVSWGDNDCNSYGAYTRVSSYETWVRDITGFKEKYKPEIPVGESLICQGSNSNSYLIQAIPDATEYEWDILPSEAGTIANINESATVNWNSDFLGFSTVRVRATIANELSDWSELDIQIAKNTVLLDFSNDTTVCAEDPVELWATAEGQNLAYNWYKNDKLLQQGSNFRISFPFSDTDHSGNYYSIISGACGTVKSDSILLTVHPLTDIISNSLDTDVEFGEQALLEINSAGHNLVYDWEKDGEYIEGKDSSVFVIDEANANDIGLYQATVSGSCGTQKSNLIYLFVTENYQTEEITEAVLWPTVIRDVFSVAVNNEEYYELLVINSKGQLVLHKRNCKHNESIDLTYFSKGVYVVKIRQNELDTTYNIVKI